MEIKSVQMFSNIKKYSSLYRQPIGISPLKQDTVSFKGSVLKKSDFQGTDLTVIEKYKPNIQQIKSKVCKSSFDLNC